MCLLLAVVWVTVPIAARPRTWDWLFRSAPEAAVPQKSGVRASPIPVAGSETIRDRTFGIEAEERAAFLDLLTAAEGAESAAGRRDITYNDLLTRPSLCRGEAVELQGTIRRLQRCTEELADDPSGPLCEAWLFTEESGTRPYRIVMRGLPEGLSPGLRVEIAARVTAYFFKLSSYRSPRGEAVAPLLVAGGLKRASD